MIFNNIDLAQILLYAFWFFFAGLVFYIRREDKRVGYPLQREKSDNTRRGSIVGWPTAPSPSRVRAMHPATPNDVRSWDVPPPERENLGLRPAANFPGAPLTPTGDPLADGVGPASWVVRSDEPELTYDGKPKIVPLALAEGEVFLYPKDTTPMGMPVYGTDGVLAGVVTDLWVERSEPQIRFLEVTLDGVEKTVLVPFEFCTMPRTGGKTRAVRVKALRAEQFAGIPQTASNEQISFTEDDQIRAYFSGGYLYAEPSRLGPWL